MILRGSPIDRGIPSKARHWCPARSGAITPHSLFFAMFTFDIAHYHWQNAKRCTESCIRYRVFLSNELGMIMLRNLRLALTGCLFAFALGGPAYADFITSAAGVTAGTGTGPGGNGNFNGATTVSTPANANNDVNTGLASTNTVTLNLEVFSLGLPFTLNIATTDVPGATEYFFTVNITNSLGNNGVDPGDSGKEIGPMDFVITGLGVLFDDIANGPNPFPTSTTHTAVNFISSTFLRFGGLSGGGGSIPYGGVGTFTFSIDVFPTATGSFGLTMTANPEPGSLALCALLGAPALSLLRRRRKPVITDLPDEAGMI